MKTQLQYLYIKCFKTQSGFHCDEIPISYQLFGCKLGSAPIVMINHALTGNSNVAGDSGWWKEIVGYHKVIDLNQYTVLSFNIPGNGYDGYEIKEYREFVAKDVAHLFLQSIKQLGIEQLYALIGGSLGGGIAWEMAVLEPNITKHLIPIASDWKSTDWLIANCQVQERILLNSSNPVHDARMHAMLSYRTPASFKERFQRSKNEQADIFNVESWLLHHGKKLQERFQLSAYRLMNQLLKTIDATNGANSQQILEQIRANIHIIGVDSDLFFTAEENRETHKQLAATHPNVTYHEVSSKHGHDAFLIEYDQLEEMIASIFNKKISNQLQILKFGGRSLSNKGIEKVAAIIQKKVEDGQRIAVVVSARGKATDQLENMLQLASEGKNYKKKLTDFLSYQTKLTPKVDYSHQITRLQNLLDGIRLLGDYSPKMKDELLAQAEIIASKTLVALLQEKGHNAKAVDARKLIVTDSNFGNAMPMLKQSRNNIVDYFKSQKDNSIQVITGFIAANQKGETTTLGRNGSNYTASLIANFLDAEELQNYTHVNGIYTANPDLVADAKLIKELTFSEANELANLGTSVLHAKTIVPLLEKNIKLRILNTFNPNNQGTLITSTTTSKGIKSLSVLENEVLINLEGRGLLGKVGVDEKVFRALSNRKISVSIISQGSSERGIGLMVPKNRAQDAVDALKQEFQTDLEKKDVSNITVIDNVAVISIVGQDLSEFHHAYNALITNQIKPILFNNTVSGKNVSLVIYKDDLHKALNVIHGQVFGVAKKINIAVFGKGLVGGTLIDQILNNTPSLLSKRKIQLNIFAVANSKNILLNHRGIRKNWRALLAEQALPKSSVQHVIEYAKNNHLENLIAVDSTASTELVKQYNKLVEAGFDLVSSNKIANTLSYSFYKQMREVLAKHNKNYLYETTVGAGLPLIDTINLLHASGENITRIRGVFSGSLSYIFNTFSENNISFSNVLKQAIKKRLLNTDPREDLSGRDVARKLLILARELDLENELQEVNIQNLIPEYLHSLSLDEFLSRIEEINEYYEGMKASLKQDEVLRYIGDLHGDLFQTKGKLDVHLIKVSKQSHLGNLSGTDAMFEIYTESYGEQPLIIQGAGAGAQVTARGVFGDILRLSKQK